MLMKTFYNIVTGQAAVFEDSAVIADWPTFQETPLELVDAAEQARLMRNALLVETDWWATSDRTMTAEMTTYRQALRDITDQSGFPTNITWPQEPSS
jgi:hypothetical protein